MNGRSVSRVCSRSHGQPLGASNRSMMSTRRVRESPGGMTVLYRRAGRNVSTKAIRREKRAFDDPEALQALCGSNNSRLKLVERTAGAQVNLRGNEITIEGEDSATETAKSAIEQLYDLALAGKPLSSDDVVRAVKLVQGSDNGAAA